MTHTRLLIAVLGAALLSYGAGCGSNSGQLCQPVNAWSASAFTCSGGEATSKPIPEDEPEETAEPEPEPEPEPEETAETEAKPDEETEAKPDEETEAKPDEETEAKPDEENEALVSIVDADIQVKGKIEFESDSDALTDESKTILDQMAKLLTDNEDIKKVRIDVNTNTGNKRASKKLAKKRVTALVKYLTKAGVKKRRLQAKSAVLKDDEGEEITFKIVKRK